MTNTHPHKEPSNRLGDALERMIDIQIAAYPSGWTEDDKRDEAERYLFGEKADA